MVLDRGGSRLSKLAREHVERANQRLFMSVISTWELYVKNAVGKLSLPEPVPAFVAGLRTAYTIDLIDVTEADLMPLADLPLHHRDPFDRILLAQSIARRLAFITPDVTLRRYDRANIVW